MMSPEFQFTIDFKRKSLEPDQVLYKKRQKED